MARENCSGCGEKKNSFNLYSTHIHNKVASGVLCRTCYVEAFDRDPSQCLVKEEWEKAFQPLGNDFLSNESFSQRIKDGKVYFASDLFSATDSEVKFLETRNKEHCVWTYLEATDGSEIVVAGYRKADNAKGYFVTLFPWKSKKQYWVVADPIAT